jgi:hypothetical protein
LTLPHERTRSVIKTEAFLRELARNTELPQDIRSYAKSLLRHYLRISEHRDRPFRLIVTGHFANA